MTATARAGNVIGGGDYAEDRIVPDIVRALRRRTPLRLRYPNATRPWQHVLDVITGYLLFAQALAEGGNDLPLALNFGPAADAGISVRHLVEAFGHAFGHKVDWELVAEPLPEQPALALDAALAMNVLGWRPRRGTMQAVQETASWYAAEQQGRDMQALSLAAIDAQVCA